MINKVNESHIVQIHMHKHFRNKKIRTYENGITIISLIVTIIILLILAGISISVLSRK